MISLGAFGVLLDCWALGMCRSVCSASRDSSIDSLWGAGSRVFRLSQ